MEFWVTKVSKNQNKVLKLKVSTQKVRETIVVTPVTWFQNRYAAPSVWEPNNTTGLPAESPFRVGVYPQILSGYNQNMVL